MSRYKEQLIDFVTWVLAAIHLAPGSVSMLAETEWFFFSFFSGAYAGESLAFGMAVAHACIAWAPRK